MVLLSSMIGNMLEWYEFALFAAFAKIIGATFYPSDNPYNEVLAVFAVYAGSFLMRPLGGIYFGQLGIQKGRKYALSASIIGMAVPTFLIGILPGYNSWGLYAPISLLLLRLAQSFSMGGEFTSSMVFTVEHYKLSRWKYFAGSFAPLSLALGVALGGIVSNFMYSTLSEVALYSYGWRIPFITSILGSLLGMWMRTKLTEPENDSNNKDQNDTIDRGKRFHSYYILLCIDMLVAVGFFYTSAYLSSHLGLFLGHNEQIVQSSIMYALLTMSVVIPITGLLCDLFKSHFFIQASACIILMIFGYCIINNMSHAPILYSSILGGIIGVYFAAIPVVLCNLFPYSTRIADISTYHNLSMTLFGGTTPLFLTYIIKTFDLNLSLTPSVILFFAASVSLFGIYKARSIKNHILK